MYTTNVFLTGIYEQFGSYIRRYNWLPPNGNDLSIYRSLLHVVLFYVFTRVHYIKKADFQWYRRRANIQMATEFTDKQTFKENKSKVS